MLVSIIIPSRDSDAACNVLKQDIASQETSAEMEVEVLPVTGVSPSGRARNAGAAQAKGDVFVFMDQDIRLGHTRIVQNLIDAVTKQHQSGVAGVSHRIPEQASPFQRRCAAEILHSEHPVLTEDRIVGMVGGACCAVRREVFDEVQGFHEKLLRGVDVDFCRRIGARGYRILQIRDSWITHPPPENLKQLAGLSFRNGRAAAYIDRFYPHLNYDIGTSPLVGRLERKTPFQRVRRYVRSLGSALVKFRWLNVTYRFFYALGYVYGFVFPDRRHE